MMAIPNWCLNLFCVIILCFCGYLDKTFSNLDFCRKQTIFVKKLIVRGGIPLCGQALLVIWSGFRPAPFCYLEIDSKSSGCASHASIALTLPLLAFAAIVSPMVILRLCWQPSALPSMRIVLRFSVVDPMNLNVFICLTLPWCRGLDVCDFCSVRGPSPGWLFSPHDFCIPHVCKVEHPFRLCPFTELNPNCSPINIGDNLEMSLTLWAGDEILFVLREEKDHCVNVIAHCVKI